MFVSDLIAFKNETWPCSYDRCPGPGKGLRQFDSFVTQHPHTFRSKLSQKFFDLQIMIESVGACYYRKFSKKLSFLGARVLKLIAGIKNHGVRCSFTIGQESKKTLGPSLNHGAPGTPCDWCEGAQTSSQRPIRKSGLRYRSLVHPPRPEPQDQQSSH